MKKVSNLLKESVWDYMKDNVKTVIVYGITLFAAVVPNFIGQINSAEIKIRLPIIIIFIISLLVSIINIWIIVKKHNKLKKDYEELLNPYNENVKKFQQGDIVMLKIEKDLENPKKMTVYKILKSEITCRNENGDLNNYVPEELLTNGETSLRFIQIESQQRRIKNQQKEFWDSINKFNSIT